MSDVRFCDFTSRFRKPQLEISNVSHFRPSLYYSSLPRFTSKFR